MDIKLKHTIISCIAAIVLTVSIPLISEASGRTDLTGGSDGIQAEQGGEGNGGYICDVGAETEDTVGEPPAADNNDAANQDNNGNNEVPTVSYPSDMTIRVLDAKSGKVNEMSFEDYITCVVCAEMPYTFNSEALKAQAVAVRSYCLYKMSSGSGHSDADICTDSSHCEAFVSKEELETKYGSSVSKKILQKVGDAVKATAGQTAVYNGKPILALFHSRSFEYTESSENVWGGKYPYLVSVSTPEKDSVTTVFISDSQMNEIFGLPSIVKASSSGSAILTSVNNSSGRVSSLSYGGGSVTGKKFRSAAGIRSTDFEYVRVNGGYELTVHGYGHGVGMSQYGANEMAKNGFGYMDIISHYYSGAAVCNIFFDPA